MSAEREPSRAAPATAAAQGVEPVEPRPSAEPTDLPATREPITRSSTALRVIALLAIVAAMQWGRDVLVPVMLGLTASYALNPIVTKLAQWHVPRALGAALLLGALLGGVGWLGASVSDDATALIESLPTISASLRQTLRASRDHRESAFGKVQRAATQLEQAAQEGSGAPPAAATPGVTRVRIERAQIDLKDYLWTSTLGLFALAGQAAVVLFIAFFLLASGDGFRRKIVRIAGPSFARRRITVTALDEINGQIQRYLLVQLFTSVVVGVLTWLIFLAIGLQHAAVWGVASAVLNLVPYLGSLVVAGGASLVALVQFGSVDMALLVAGAMLALHTVTGNLLAPWLTSRASQMNPVTVFVGVLAFGWLWGPWGLLLGVPILTMVKVVCDRVESLHPVGELLGA